MDREVALKQLELLIGNDLRSLADTYDGITVWKDGYKNKGWAGHTIERYLGLPLNSSRAPNFGSWELKVVSLVAKANGLLRVKETMAITMLDPVEVAAKTFEESHLFNKMRKAIILARIFETQAETRSLVHSVAVFDLDKPDIYSQVKADYDLVRSTILNPELGFAALTGAMGKLVQPRTKGPGHGSVSRAFYARTGFVAAMLGEGHRMPLPIEKK
ncbi:MAG: MvaI/BcnI family restriction endonuclease [Aggregatilineales bacterium]